MKPSRVVAAAAVWAFVVSATPGAQTGDAPALLRAIDHVVYATPDLSSGVRRIETLLGIQATPGGQHPGEGTRNALIALGPTSYLEIIGPDPDQPKPDHARRFGIDDLTAPRVVTWAAKGTNLTQFVADARRRGVPLGDVLPGSRRTPAGVLLSWHVTDQRAVAANNGLVPFFIDWGVTPHPAKTAAPGATLLSLRGEHPNPENVQRLLGELGLQLPVAKGASPSLVATIVGARGRVELR